MSNWAGNPMHQKQSLMGYSLPQLLFTECHKYCVNAHEIKIAESESEKTCISNCQSKTYKAFDMYMKLSVKAEQYKDVRSYIDLSRYTEMEVEHGSDTASQIYRSSEGPHVHDRPIKEFTNQVDTEYGSLKTKAIG